MLRRVALVRTEVSHELIASIIRMRIIGELGTTVVPASLILLTLMMEAMLSSETSVLTRILRRNNPEDDTLNRKCFGSLIGFRPQVLRGRHSVGSLRNIGQDIQLPALN
jgi:hypothetical protein